jgi:hypothetical protein
VHKLQLLLFNCLNKLCIFKKSLKYLFLTLAEDVENLRNAIDEYDLKEIDAIMEGKDMRYIYNLLTLELTTGYKSSAIRFACAKRSYEIVRALVAKLSIQLRQEVISKNI